MDRSNVDSAFERFITSTIATLITIIFSWRLLVEMNDVPPARQEALEVKETPVQRDIDIDSDSESENSGISAVLARPLEAITEEDTDDLSEVDDKGKLIKVTMETSETWMFNDNSPNDSPIKEKLSSEFACSKELQFQDDVDSDEFLLIPNTTKTCTAVATSKAKNEENSIVASAKATGLNPYIAVARATAKAASTASANLRKDSPRNLDVTISTSVRIEDDDCTIRPSNERSSNSSIFYVTKNETDGGDVLQVIREEVTVQDDENSINYSAMSQNSLNESNGEKESSVSGFSFGGAERRRILMESEEYRSFSDSFQRHDWNRHHNSKNDDLFSLRSSDWIERETMGSENWSVYSENQWTALDTDSQTFTKKNRFRLSASESLGEVSNNQSTDISFSMDSNTTSRYRTDSESYLDNSSTTSTKNSKKKSWTDILTESRRSKPMKEETHLERKTDSNTNTNYEDKYSTTISNDNIRSKDPERNHSQNFNNSLRENFSILGEKWDDRLEVNDCLSNQSTVRPNFPPRGSNYNKDSAVEKKNETPGYFSVENHSNSTTKQNDLAMKPAPKSIIKKVPFVSYASSPQPPPMEEEFEKRKKKFQQNSLKNLVVVDIDIENDRQSHKKKALYEKALKQLTNYKPKIKEVSKTGWDVKLNRLYKSHGNIRSISSSTSSIAGQFFTNRGNSCSNLLETDIDSLEQRHVQETDIDEAWAEKSQSMTNLNKSKDSERRRFTPDFYTSEIQLDIWKSSENLDVPKWFRNNYSGEKINILKKNPRPSLGCKTNNTQTNSTSDKVDDGRPKPVVILKRVTRPLSKSCESLRIGHKLEKFELPSTKLKNQSPSLKPIKILSKEEILGKTPPKVPQKTDECREAYLKYRMQISNNSNENKLDDDKNPLSHIKEDHQKILNDEKISNNSNDKKEVDDLEKLSTRINGQEESKKEEEVDKRTPIDTFDAQKYIIHKDRNIDKNEVVPNGKSNNQTGDESEISRWDDDIDKPNFIRRENEIPQNLRDSEKESNTKITDGFPVLTLQMSPGSKRRLKSPILPKKDVQIQITKTNADIDIERVFNQLLGNNENLDDDGRSNLEILETEESNIGVSKFSRRESVSSFEEKLTFTDIPNENNNVSSKSKPLRPSVRRLGELPNQDSFNIQIRCRNSSCSKSVAFHQARETYKTCHSCYTYYCSKECRTQHWDQHKRKCLYSKVNSLCKNVLKKIHDEKKLLYDFSKKAKTGFLTKGRGCLILVFKDQKKAEEFINVGSLKGINSNTLYVSLNDLKKASDEKSGHLSELIEMVNSYNPDLKWVMDVEIVASELEYQQRPKPRKTGPVIKRCVKLRLSSDFTKQTKRIPEYETLILTAVPGSEFTENLEGKKARELCFANIQRKFQERGVSLQKEFPKVYGQLCKFVEKNEHFSPISIYPVDRRTGKRFMCLIMPDSEPEIEWITQPDIAAELDLSTDL